MNDKYGKVAMRFYFNSNAPYSSVLHYSLFAVCKFKAKLG